MEHGSHGMPEKSQPADTWWFGVERKWWTLAVVGAGTFMSALDGSIVNTALPVIRRSTETPVSTAEWVVLIYLLTVSSSLLVFGRLGDIYGQRGIYITGLVGFVGGSVLCGLSRSIGLLIGFRGLQALGAAMLFALAPAVLTSAFPSRERGRALGMQATMTYLGLSTGPALGGFITHYFGWPWIFFVNLPIGTVVTLVALNALRRETARARQPFDPAGAAALAVSLALLLIGLSQANRLGWGNRVIVASLVLAGGTFVVFVLIERALRHPVLDLRLFANRTFAASTAAAFLSYMATASMSFLMPFYLIDASRYPPDEAGLILISTPVVMALLAGPSGALSDRIGVRIPATVGMALTVAGLLLLRMLYAGSSPSHIVPYLALVGLGSGLFNSPNNSAIMGSAPRNRQGVAGAILAAARNIGFVMGTAVGVAIYLARFRAFGHAMPSSVAITRAMQDATTVLALVASAGIVLSAVRGRTPRAAS